MLDPEYLWHVADPVVDIWESLNQWAIQDIVYRLMMAEIYNYDKLPGTARWRTWLLNQSGMHYEEIIKKIEQISNRSEEELRNLFVAAGLISMENDAAVFDKHGITSPDLKSNKRFMQLLNAAYEQTNGSMHNFTGTTADASQKLLLDTLDRAYFDTISGNRSASEVISDAIDTVASSGVKVTYPSGHIDTVETAVRRAVQTGISQGTAKVSLENCRQLGAEYVVVDAHPGARVSDKDPIANHMGWQGKVYKIDGSSRQYENLEKATGFPSNPLGLCGYNCRHHIFPFFPGEDINRWENLVDEEESRKLYEASQKQRRMERNIRASKRKLQGLSTAIENCKDEKTKFELQMEYDKTAARLQGQNKAYRDFCKDNADMGVQRQADRLKPYGWNREDAYAAVKAGNRYEKTVSRMSYAAKESEWNGTKPLYISKESKQELIEYAANKDVKIIDLSNFDGKPDLLKSQIDTLSKLQNDYADILGDKKCVLTTRVMDAGDFAETVNRTIVVNTGVLRDREVTESYIAEDPLKFAERTIEDIVSHEFAHVLANIKGNIGIELTKKAYYNLYKINLTNTEAEEYLYQNISHNATMCYEYAKKINIEYQPRKLKEIIPEVFVKNIRQPTEFTREFIRLFRE